MFKKKAVKTVLVVADMSTDVTRFKEIFTEPSVQFERLVVDPFEADWVSSVKTKLKCMCKKHRRKPDLLSALFNMTYEMQLASLAGLICKFYSTSLYSEQLENMFRSRMFYRYKVALPGALDRTFFPNQSWYDKLGLLYVSTRRPMLTADSLRATQMLSRQIGSTKTNGEGDASDTFVIDGDWETIQDDNTISDFVIWNYMRHGYSMRFDDINVSSQIGISKGVPNPINVYAAKLQSQFPVPFRTNNELFLKLQGLDADANGKIREERLSTAYHSWKQNLF